jgi:SHS2 domain-containing protein
MMPEIDEPQAGHRLVAHTADLILEAWAPEWRACLVEAVRALVESFVDREDAADSADRANRSLHAGARDPEGQLVALLDEVIYLLDAEDLVAVDVEINDVEPELRGRFAVVPVDAVTAVGPAPKAVSLHGLDVHKDDGWSCRVLVDV